MCNVWLVSGQEGRKTILPLLSRYPPLDDREFLAANTTPVDWNPSLRSLRYINSHSLSPNRREACNHDLVYRGCCEDDDEVPGDQCLESMTLSDLGKPPLLVRELGLCEAGDAAFLLFPAALPVTTAAVMPRVNPNSTSRGKIIIVWRSRFTAWLLSLYSVPNFGLGLREAPRGRSLLYTLPRLEIPHPPPPTIA